MPKKAEDSRAVVHLAEHGPVPKRELPVQNFARNVRALVGTLNITGSQGAGSGVAGGLTEVAYLRDRHDIRTVVETWVDVNAEQIETLPAESVRRRLRASVPRDQRDAVSEVLTAEGFGVDHSDTGGRQTEPFYCGLCGSSVKDIASHLPECPER